MKQPLQLKISSFNIRCYGFGGNYNGRLRDENRNSHLRNFISSHLNNSDVIVFQEIIDVESFKSILPDDYSLKTYDHDFNRHQHVVIAYKKKYELKPLNETYVIPGITIDERRSRPAMHGLLFDTLSKTPIAQIIGVHLKSGPLHSDIRIQQAKTISEYIQSLDTEIPIIITGDFNTRPATKNGPSDISKLNDCFEPVGLSRIDNDIDTYRTAWENQCLDHFWISEAYLPKSKFWVYDVDQYSDLVNKIDNLKLFYKEISDHLPVSLSFYFTTGP